MADTPSFVIERSNEVYRNLKLYSSEKYSEILKMSNRKNVTITTSYVGGGIEDSIDIVRGENILLNDLVLSSLRGNQTRTFITVKGGVDGIIIKNINLIGETKYPWDISLGDWTIYDVDKNHPPVRNIRIEHISHENGRPIRVLCLHSEVPEVIGKNVKILRIPPIFVKIWFGLKRFFSK